MRDDYLKQRLMWNEDAFKLGWAYKLRHEIDESISEYIGILIYIDEQELQFVAVSYQDPCKNKKKYTEPMPIKIKYTDIPEWEIRML